ncbi:MinD/ParA family ATP-binding protein [Rhodococcus koreensis]|uniref:MinD/ParA family ATP-binding protein n=1 Tax=Rhodococcus koreensis TaxID=99653 RepID=UPI001981BF0F|nr:MinD/ParA family protein [Rhodococcus koreensis]QSE87002.1 MinD/ParA family protein [Rhodococcus koreensis]
MSQNWMDGLRDDEPQLPAQWNDDLDEDSETGRVFPLRDDRAAMNVSPEHNDSQREDITAAPKPLAADDTAPDAAAVGVSSVSVGSPLPVSPPVRVPTDAAKLPRLGQRNDLVVEQVKPVPRSGWRRALFMASLKTINAGENPADVREHEIDMRIAAPIRSDHKITVAGLKGGVAKSTVSIALGHAFASVRSDRVLAVDANPDAGVLAERIAQVGPRAGYAPTIYDLIADTRHDRYSDVRAHTLEAETGLQVLASHDDPARSEALSESDYRQAMTILQDHYQVLVSDCGTGITHPVMCGVLDLTDSLIAPTKLDVSAVTRTNAMLDWLDAHHYQQLVQRSVVVISRISGQSKTPLSEQQVRDYFDGRVRAVVTIPFDRHLDEGAEIYWERLQPATRHAYRGLAQLVAEDFGHTVRPEPALVEWSK